MRYFMTFTQSVKTCFTKYADFKGRASRSEYWWFVLFAFFGGVFFSLLGYFLLGEDGQNFFAGLFELLVIIPSLSLAFRRLHDSGKIAWNLLWGFTIIGALFPLIYWYLQKGDEGSNQYGDPS